METIFSNWKYIVLVIFVIVFSFVLTKILRKILGRYLEKSASKLDADSTNFNFLKNSLTFIITISSVIIIFYFIPPFKELGLSILAGAGIFAAILGFASQAAFSNIISGIFIVIFKPFRVGDTITLQQHNGIIEDITLRHTVIRNWENRRVIIPNSIISNETILNSSITDATICNFFEIGISYDSNLDKAIELIIEEATAHPNFIDKRSEQEILEGKSSVKVMVTGWGDSSINIRAYLWSIDNSKGYVMKCDLFKSLKKRFDEEGIEIPYPHRTIVTKTKGN